MRAAIILLHKDPEITMRVREICKKLAGIPQYGEQKAILELKNNISSVRFHPNGRHWIATEGTDAGANLIFGEYHNGRITLLRRIMDGHSPSTVRFGKDGKTVYTNNRDGTVSVYSDTSR